MALNGEWMVESGDRLKSQDQGARTRNWTEKLKVNGREYKS
jgi:hypothetical protein